MIHRFRGADRSLQALLAGGRDQAGEAAALLGVQDQFGSTGAKQQCQAVQSCRPRQSMGLEDHPAY